MGGSDQIWKIPDFFFEPFPYRCITIKFIFKVPDVVSKTTSQGGQGEQDGSNKKEKEVVQISQLLPGYARSYAGDYVPNEV